MKYGEVTRRQTEEFLDRVGDLWALSRLLAGELEVAEQMHLAPVGANQARKETENYKRVTLGQVEAAINKIGGLSIFRRVLAGKLFVREKHYPITLDPNMGLMDLLLAGNYAGDSEHLDWAHGIFEATFRKEESASGRRVILLLHFEGSRPTSSILREAAGLGLELPSIRDALHFGAQHPRPVGEDERSIIFPHRSLVHNKTKAGPYLRRDRAGRQVGIHYADPGCCYRARFAFVLKVG